MKRILIAAPLRQDIDVFLEYQKSLDALVIPNGVVVDRFFVVNDCPEIVPYIKGEHITLNSGDEYKKTETDHIWTPHNLAKMPILRNACITRCLEGGYDYMFSVDTDLILHSMTLKTLLDADKDIISEIFYTDDWSNAWQYDQCTGCVPCGTTGGLFKVGMTGALTLIKSEVFRKGVDYSPIPNIRRALWGEDRWFCIRAACAGFEMYADTHFPATHLFTRSEFEKYMGEVK